MRADRALTGWVTMAAGILSAGLAVGPPATWFLFSHERLVGGIEAEAEVGAHLISQVVGANPELWEFEFARLTELLARRPKHGAPEIRRVRNARGDVVAESADPLPSPVIVRALPLSDAGMLVGSVEIVRSLRPLIARSVLLFLALAASAAFLFRALRTVPLAALRRTEGELRRQRDAAQKYLDVAGIAFVIVDAAGRVALVNRKGAELLGRSPGDVIGRDWLATFVEADDRKRLPAAAAAAPGEVFNVEFSILRPAGERRVVDWYATPLPDAGTGGTGLLLSGVDLTHQRQLEEQLRHAQKLRAVGQLAGGVAHDFNNIIAAIRSRAAMIRADLVVGSPHRLDAEEILAAADRAAALTRSLLTFGRRQALAIEDLELGELVRRSERRLRLLIQPPIALEVRTGATEVRVVADPIQLEQVLSHLVANARDAIEGEGRIVVATSSLTLDAAGARRMGVGAPGAYATITVTDDGVGLDPEALARIFEPFYTTKEIGKGMGLGLAIAFGIVELHRGTIRVASEPGAGTAVTVVLPSGIPARAEPLALPAPPPGAGTA